VERMLRINVHLRRLDTWQGVLNGRCWLLQMVMLKCCEELCMCWLQELQVVVLKCREELLSEKVGRERDIELLHSELQLLRSQTTNSDRSQQQMSREISHLREQLG